jgi:hypothetical protein
VKWLMAYCDFESQMDLSKHVDKSKMVGNLFNGQTLSNFDYNLRKRLEVEILIFQIMTCWN